MLGSALGYEMKLSVGTHQACGLPCTNSLGVLQGT